jgi:predicted nucleic-acid-binding protein
MLAIDTNVLVRLIARDDVGQVKKAEAFVAKGAWVSHLVLAETVWVLASTLGRTPAQIASAVEVLLNHATLSIQDGDVVAAALDLNRAHPSLGFTDCLLLEIAKKAGHIPMGTFDRGPSKLDGTQRL